MSWEVWAILGLAVLVLALVVAAWLASTETGRRNRAQLRHAQRGESLAETVLRAQGFEVLERQVTGQWPIIVDGESHEVSCRADLLVEATGAGHEPKGTRFIAEVKTGQHAPDPLFPATRRQLLAYTRAFDVDGTLLVDMEMQTVYRVSFPD